MRLMIRWCWNLLYGSTPAEFRSAYGLGESVQRLRAATKRSVFSAMGETTAVGKVSEESVRLQRVIPMVGNSFKPFFIGRFESRDGKVVLAGKFTMLMFVKAFMTVWFGVVGLCGLVVLLGGRSTESHTGFFVLQPLGMLGGGLALVAVGKWFVRNDEAWLSRVIEGALSLPREGGSLASSTLTAAEEDTVPIALKGMALFLTASGVGAVVSGFALRGLTRRSVAATDVPPFPTLGRWSFVYAALVIALALGVWRRRRWAWQGVSVLLVLSGCWSAYAMYATQAGLGPPVVIEVVFALLFCAVVALWGRWWYAQRKYFP